MMNAFLPFSEVINDGVSGTQKQAYAIVLYLNCAPRARLPRSYAVCSDTTSSCSEILQNPSELRRTTF